MNYVNEKDIDLLIKMFDENFGEGYMSKEEIKEHINSEKDLFYAARREDGTICGIMLYCEEDLESLSEETKIPKDKLISMAKGKKLLKTHNICVAKDCQKTGIGIELMKGSIDDIRKRGEYGLTTASLWEYNGKAPAKKLAEDNGYKYIHRLKMPWYNLENYYCVICKGRCRCDGLQYVLTFD